MRFAEQILKAFRDDLRDLDEIIAIREEKTEELRKEREEMAKAIAELEAHTEKERKGDVD